MNQAGTGAGGLGTPAGGEGLLPGLSRAAARIFARDVERWGLSPVSALMIALFPVLATLAFIAAVPMPGLFMWMIDEDSLLESVQFILVLAATAVFARLSARLIRDRRGVGLLYVLVTAGLFFVTGEEISWGQRILGLRTPGALEAINTQQEISVHNIRGLHGPFIYAVMLAGLYGAVVPLLGLALRAGDRSGLGRLLVPPLCLVPAFFMPFGYRLCRLVLQPERFVEPGYRVFVITEFNELTELCLYFGLLVFGWLNLRARPEPRVPPPSPVR